MTDNNMAKVGYIFKANYYESFDEDKEWMQKYGCVHVVEEEVEHETLRPMWKQMMSNLDRGDEIVVAKFSNAVRGSRELASLIEYCRIKHVRIISIHDRIDSQGKLFPDTTVAQVLEMFGSLPAEAVALRRASAHVMHLQQNIRPKTSGKKTVTRAEREKIIVDMYNSGYSLEEIWKASGFKSKSSVFRVLKSYHVKLNRRRPSELVRQEREKGNKS